MEVPIEISRTIPHQTEVLVRVVGREVVDLREQSVQFAQELRGQLVLLGLGDAFPGGGEFRLNTANLLAMHLQEPLDPPAAIGDVGRTQIALQEIPKASHKGNLGVVLKFAGLIVEDEALAGVSGEHPDDGPVPERIVLVHAHREDLHCEQNGYQSLYHSKFF